MYDLLNQIFSEPERTPKLASVCYENELEPMDVKWLSHCCPGHRLRGGPEGRRRCFSLQDPQDLAVHGACSGHVCR